MMVHYFISNTNCNGYTIIEKKINAPRFYSNPSITNIGRIANNNTISIQLKQIQSK